MVGSGYLYVATVETSIFRHPSRVAERIHRRNGSWLICTSSLHGRTNFCSLQSSRLNEKNRRRKRVWSPWTSVSLSSARPSSRRTTTSKNSIIGEFVPLVVGTNTPMNARGWPIPTVSLKTVSFPLSLKRWGYPDLIFRSSCIALSQEEVDGFMGRLFDKDPPTAQPADLPLPYSSENLPPSVRVTVFQIVLQPAMNISL
jgi:hypothetical protein